MADIEPENDVPAGQGRPRKDFGLQEKAKIIEFLKMGYFREMAIIEVGGRHMRQLRRAMEEDPDFAEDVRMAEAYRKQTMRLNMYSYAISAGNNGPSKDYLEMLDRIDRIAEARKAQRRAEKIEDRRLKEERRARRRRERIEDEKLAEAREARAKAEALAERKMALEEGNRGDDSLPPVLAAISSLPEDQRAALRPLLDLLAPKAAPDA